MVVSEKVPQMPLNLSVPTTKNHDEKSYDIEFFEATTLTMSFGNGYNGGRTRMVRSSISRSQLDLLEVKLQDIGVTNQSPVSHQQLSFCLLV